MPSPTARARRSRWSVVAVGTALLVVLTVGGLPASGTAPGATPLRLLQRAAASTGVAHTGTALSTGAIGLPDLPRLSDTASLLGETTRTRVWWVDPGTWRVAVLTSTGERDTYLGGGRLGIWDYAATDLTTGPAPSGARLPRAGDLEPPQLVRGLLSGPDGVARAARGATGLGARRVAGRAADGVRVRGGSADSSLDHADVWVDRASGLPLAVQLVDRAGVAAMSTRFDAVQLAPPDTAALRPPRPPGTAPRAADTDIAGNADTGSPWLLPTTLAGLPTAEPDLADHGVGAYGTGLARLAAVPLTPRVGDEAVQAARAAGGPVLPRVHGGTAGGEAVSLRAGALSAAVVRADDGRHAYLLAGTVTVAVLQAAVDQLLADPPPWRTS